MKTTQRDQRAWAAGFFDGEGCVGVYHNQGRYVLSVSVSQGRREPLEILLAMFGGSIQRDYRPGGYNGKGTYSWRISGNKAAKALKAMLPFLVVKLAQAEVALEFFEINPTFEVAKEYSAHLKEMKS